MVHVSNHGWVGGRYVNYHKVNHSQKRKLQNHRLYFINEHHQLARHWLSMIKVNIHGSPFVTERNWTKCMYSNEEAE